LRYDWSVKRRRRLCCGSYVTGAILNVGGRRKSK
jgi:hypothetical protein